MMRVFDIYGSVVNEEEEFSMKIVDVMGNVLVNDYVTDGSRGISKRVISRIEFEKPFRTDKISMIITVL